MTKRDRSAVKRIYTVFMAVVLILTSVMLGCFVKYIYNEQRNGAMADTVSGDADGDDLKYQKISVTVGKKKDELIKLDGMMPVSADVKVEKGDSSKSDTLCAYDITIMDGVGKSFQPTEESPITVEIKNDVFSKCSEKDLHLWHIDDAGIREEVTDFTVDGDSIIFAATGFSLYEVTTGEPQLCTYEFYTLDNDTYKKYYYSTTSGKQICQQIIKKSDNLVTPQLPANNSKTFLGWYILQENEGSLKATSTKVNFDDPQGFVSGGTVKIGAVYENCVYLIFHDQSDDKLKSEPIVETRRGILNNGKAVISVDGVEVTYDDDKESSATHMVFAGWSTVRVEPGVSAALVGYNGNDFIGTVEVTENTPLYPVFTKSAWLSFSTGGIAQGAESIPQVMQNVNEPVEKLPVPKRDGYSFEGWYTDDTFTKKIGDEQGHILSNITDSGLPETMELKGGKIYLNEDTKLYAKWTAAETHYTVVIWRQSINDKVNTADDKKTYDYAESHSFNATTGDTASVPDNLKNMSGDEYKGFYYRACDSNKAVAGDGSTILNVYYDRMKVTYQFYRGQTSWSGTTTWSIISSYTMTGLYDQRLYDCGYEWPSVTNSNKSYYYNESDNRQVTMTYLDAFNHIDNLPESVTDSNHTYITQRFYEADGGTPSNIYQLRQKLDGTYTISDSEKSAWTLTHAPGSSNSTFKFSNKFNGFTVGYYSLESFTANPTDQAVIGNVVNNSNKDLYVYNKRNHYNLDFKNSWDNTVYKTKSVLYEDTLPQPDNAPEPPTGYKFKCWTYDPEGNQAVNFENDKMPANNLAVYAQWEKLRYLVEIDPNGGKFEIQSDGEDNSGYSTWFWVNYDDTISEYKNVTRNYRMSQDGHYYYRYLDREYYDLGDEYSEGEASITDRSAGYTKEAKEATDLLYRYEEARDAYRYAGWYKVKEDGSEVPYQFDDPVRENTHLRLHWKALGTYYIKYEPGEGILDDQDHSEDQFKVMDDADYADKAHVVITRTVKETPDGKNFIGWRLRNDPSGNLYYPGGAFEFNSAYAEKVIDDEGNERRYMILEAVYQAVDEPSIIYDANGGTMTANADHGNGTFLEDTTESDRYVYNTDAGRLTVKNLVNNTQVTLSSGEGFSNSNPNYIFCGWNTKADGKGTHYDPGSVLFIDKEGDNPAVLYAEWKIKVCFDKNNESADWGGDWSEYQTDGDRKYIETFLNSKIDEPPYTPSSPQKVFTGWSTTQYSGDMEGDGFDFSQPITQELIDAQDGSSDLVLYAMWNTPPAIPFHVVDSSAATLEQVDGWRKQTDITVYSGTPVELTNADSYVDPADGYKYAFPCVSDSLANVSEENRITNIYYDKDTRSVHVTFADGTTAPLKNGEEIYFAYYKNTLPVGYVEMGLDGSLTDVSVSVSNSAPKTVDITDNYNMSGSITAPRSWANNQYGYYSYAIGDKSDSAGSANSSALHFITASSGSDSNRPTLKIRATWRGYEYSADDGATWSKAGYNIKLYTVYYKEQPTIVNLHEQTIGKPEDMDKKFTYTVNIINKKATVDVEEYYYYDSNNVKHIVNGGNNIYAYNYVVHWRINGSDYQSETLSQKLSQIQDSAFTTPNILTNTVMLSNGQTESFTLFNGDIVSNIGEESNLVYDGIFNGVLGEYDVYYGVTSGTIIPTTNYYHLLHRTTTYDVIRQSIEIVQEETPETQDFTTEMGADPTGNNIVVANPRYTYTESLTQPAPQQPTPKNVTYTNKRESVPIEVHVAIAKGDGYYKHDEYRTNVENNYKGSLKMNVPDGIDLKQTFDPDALITEDGYIFAGIVYGSTSDSTKIDVAGKDITEVKYGQISGNVYDVYLNGNKNMPLDTNEIYYVYYKAPVIKYYAEGANGDLVLIDPLTIENKPITLNGNVVQQDATLPFESNKELVISQTIKNAYRIPPIFDFKGTTVPIEYTYIGVGAPDAAKLSDLDYSEGRELRLTIEDGKVKYRFNGSAEAQPLPTADELVVYAVYKGGNKLTISKTVDKVDQNVGYPTFQFLVKRIEDGDGNKLPPAESEEKVISLTFRSSGTQETELVKLPLGKYEVTELSNINYNMESITVAPERSSTVEGTKATVVMGRRSEIKVSYDNRLKRDEKKTYQTFADNHIEYKNS